MIGLDKLNMRTTSPADDGEQQDDLLPIAFMLVLGSW